MTMRPGVRKFALTAHVTSSVGWLGAVAGSMAIAVAAVTSGDPQIVRGAYLTLELTGWYVLVPFAFASLLTGLVQALGTTWGLFRHYWGPVQTPDDPLRHRRTAPVHGDLELSRGVGGGHEATASGAALSVLKSPSAVIHSGGAMLLVACGRDAVGVQAAGHDSVRATQAAGQRSAAASCARTAATRAVAAIAAAPGLAPNTCCRRATGLTSPEPGEFESQRDDCSPARYAAPCGSCKVWDNGTHGGYWRYEASQAGALVTPPIKQTEERGGLLCLSLSTGSSLGAAVLLMAALFLAHGLQCAAASDHGPVAVGHTLVAPVAADDTMHHGTAGHESDRTLLLTVLSDPVATVGGRDGSAQAGVVCVAVLTAMGLWFLSARKSLLSGQGALLWPAGGPTSQVRAAARWRPPPLDQAVLCVLRT